MLRNRDQEYVKDVDKLSRKIPPACISITLPNSQDQVNSACGTVVKKWKNDEDAHLLKQSFEALKKVQRKEDKEIASRRSTSPLTKKINDVNMNECQEESSNDNDILEFNVRDNLSLEDEDVSEPKQKSSAVHPRFIITLNNLDPMIKARVEEGEEENKTINLSRSQKVVTTAEKSDSRPDSGCETRLKLVEKKNVPQISIPATQLSKSADNCKLKKKLSSSETNSSSIITPTVPKITSKITEVCKFWPNCLAGEKCPFVHLSASNVIAPNSKVGNRYNYSHPNCKYPNPSSEKNSVYSHTVQAGDRLMDKKVTAVKDSPPINLASEIIKISHENQEEDASNLRSTSPASESSSTVKSNENEESSNEDIIEFNVTENLLFEDEEELEPKQNSSPASPRFIITLNNLDPVIKARAEEEEIEVVKQVKPSKTLMNSETPDLKISETNLPISNKGVSPVIIAVSPSSQESGDDLKLKKKLPLSVDSNSNAVTNPTPVKAVNKVADICKFWPKCLAGEKCPFVHMSTSCVNFPNCKFGSRCMYTHPKCKFLGSCVRKNCPYSHPASVLVSSQPVSSSQTCKFFPQCSKVACPFFHPKLCKFGANCVTKDCVFTHPHSAGNKFKWSKTSDGHTVSV